AALAGSVGRLKPPSSQDEGTEGAPRRAKRGRHSQLFRKKHRRYVCRPTGDWVAFGSLISKNIKGGSPGGEGLADARSKLLQNGMAVERAAVVAHHS
ncbi:MAG: hypothetical protein OD811_06645, partial [Alphaproteobacteria bacterium]